MGRIETDEDGPTFTYDESWRSLRGAFPISVTMPLTQEKAEPTLFSPWAANLLPEAAQLTAIGRHLGVAPADVIGLLSEIGRDTAGALSFGDPGTARTGAWRQIQTDAELERIILELPNKPFLAGEDGVSMSLAGVQSKLAVGVDESGNIYVPVNGAPSTHILKPDSDRLHGSVQNEAFCLTLARLCGLKAPDIRTGKAGNRSYFLIRRYDRRQVEDRWRRLHQEDFCQGLSKPPAAKYEKSQSGIRGVTIKDMTDLVRSAMSARDVLSLVDYIIFNVLACNTDAHAKNYSLMITARAPSLAPLYDVMCAEPYEGITKNLAQTIAGKNRGEHLLRRHWIRFFKEIGLAPNTALVRVQKLAELVQAKAGDAERMVAEMPAGAHFVLAEVRKSIERRAQAILAGLRDYTGVA